MSISEKPSLEKVSDSKLDDVKLKISSDEDFDFGGDSTLPPAPNLTAEEEKKLWRKIDLRLMPILSLMYLMSFLDRGAYFQIQTISTSSSSEGNIGESCEGRER